MADFLETKRPNLQQKMTKNTNCHKRPSQVTVM